MKTIKAWALVNEITEDFEIERYGDTGRYWIYTKRRIAEIQKEKEDKIVRIEIKILKQ